MPHGNCGGNDQGRLDVEMIRAGQSVSAVNGQCEVERSLRHFQETRRHPGLDCSGSEAPMRITGRV